MLQKKKASPGTPLVMAVVRAQAIGPGPDFPESVFDEALESLEMLLSTDRLDKVPAGTIVNDRYLLQWLPRPMPIKLFSCGCSHTPFRKLQVLSTRMYAWDLGSVEVTGLVRVGLFLLVKPLPKPLQHKKLRSKLYFGARFAFGFAFVFGDDFGLGLSIADGASLKPASTVLTMPCLQFASEHTCMITDILREHCC